MANLLNFSGFSGFPLHYCLSIERNSLSVFNFFEHSGIFDGLRCGASFSTPRMRMHMWVASQNTITPLGGELACQQVADLSCHAFLHLQPSGEDVDRACDFA